MNEAKPQGDESQEIDLDEIHARMRARDRARIESGEATPQQIQDENSIFPKFKTFRILNFTA